MSMTRIRARAEARGTYVHTQTTRSVRMATPARVCTIRTGASRTIRLYVCNVPCATVGIDLQRCLVRYVRTYVPRVTHGITLAHGRTYVRAPTVKTTPSVRDMYELMCMRAHCESCRGLALRRYAVALPPAPQPPLVDLVTHVPRDDHGMTRPVRSAMRVIKRCV